MDSLQSCIATPPTQNSTSSHKRLSIPVHMPSITAQHPWQSPAAAWHNHQGGFTPRMQGPIYVIPIPNLQAIDLNASIQWVQTIIRYPLAYRQHLLNIFNVEAKLADPDQRLQIHPFLLAVAATFPQFNDLLRALVLSSHPYAVSWVVVTWELSLSLYELDYVLSSPLLVPAFIWLRRETQLRHAAQFHMQVEKVITDNETQKYLNALPTNFETLPINELHRLHEVTIPALLNQTQHLAFYFNCWANLASQSLFPQALWAQVVLYAEGLEHSINLIQFHALKIAIAMQNTSAFEGFADDELEIADFLEKAQIGRFDVEELQNKGLVTGRDMRLIGLSNDAYHILQNGRSIRDWYFREKPRLLELARHLKGTSIYNPLELFIAALENPNSAPNHLHTLEGQARAFCLNAYLAQQFENPLAPLSTWPQTYPCISYYRLT